MVTSLLRDVDPDAAMELRFLASHSRTKVVDMQHKHTYFNELSQNKRTFAATLLLEPLRQGQGGLQAAL